MSKWCFNYESGEYVYNWDDSEYKQEERESALWCDDEDEW